MKFFLPRAQIIVKCPGFAQEGGGGTLVPEVFLEFSLRERAAKRRERKTSGYLGLESHFHADAGVMI